MKDSNYYLEKGLKFIILSGPLKEINLYQVNDNFFELAEEGYWVIDNGIELKFPSGTISAAWSSKLESFIIESKTVVEIYEQDNHCKLSNDNIDNLNRFVGLNVIDVNFKSIELDFVVDYTMRTKKEKRFVEIILEFQNKSKIQIAFVDYYLKENEPPTDFTYNIATELVVSTKKNIEIKT